MDFDGLVVRHESAILAYCLRRARQPVDAEEAAAETFIVAWRRLDEAPEEDRILPWLYGIARRVLANQRRGDERRQRLSARLSATVTPPPNLGEAAGPAIAALERLRPDDRELLRLVAWEGLRHDEIAEVLSVSVNAVAIRLHRARVRFEQELRATSNADELKEIEGRRTSTRLKGRMIGLLRREPSE